MVSWISWSWEKDGLRNGISLVRELQVTRSMVVLCCGFPFLAGDRKPS